MELNQRIEKYWDNRSESFSKTRRLELSGRDAEGWREIFRKNLPEGRALKILDVGTGAGFFAAILSEMGHDVIGIDMSAKMLREAAQNLRELNLYAEFIKMNAQVLDFADETFDVVVTRNLTWTLPDVKAAYHEWRRVLKVGGVLMNFDSDYGDKQFSVCSKSPITDEQVNECDEIKDALTISTRRRPMWDAGFLEGLDFIVRLTEDISSFVHRDSRCSYDTVPMFAIHAVK